MHKRKMDTLKAVAAGSYVIAGGAAWLSYTHQKTLYLANEIGTFSYVVPLLVDVLALMATAVRNHPEVKPALKRTATGTLLLAGLGSVLANVAVAINPVQVAIGFGTVLFYVMAENFVAALKKAATVAKTEEAAAMAAVAGMVTMAKTDLDAMVATIVAKAEQDLRVQLAAEAEQAAREAAAAQAVATAEADRIAREAALADRLAAVEAERVALASQLATATATATAKPVATAKAKPVVVAKAPGDGVPNGDKAAAVLAVLAEFPDMATEDVATLTDASQRTVRRVRAEMRLAAEIAV